MELDDESEIGENVDVKEEPMLIDIATRVASLLYDSL